MDMDLSSPCVETTGPRTEKGYGSNRVTIGKRTRPKIYAHRFAFERAWGIPIPPGKVVRHSCDNPPCVNPLHLMIGTQKDNVRDMMDRGRRGRTPTTHCLSGHHEWTPDNIYTNPGNRKSQCRPCLNDAKRKRRARRGK